MGCVLGCLRIEDDGRRCQFFSKSLSWMKRELAVTMNRYASVASSAGSGEKGSPSEKSKREIFQGSFDGDEGALQELRQEANFLKSCGAILGTPVEIRSASEQHKVFSDEFSIKINLDQQGSSCKLPSPVPETVPSQEERYNRLQYDEYNDTSSKALAFEEKHSGSKTGLDSSLLDVSPQNENQEQQHSFESPYPTPSYLVDVIQTPGTVYPSKFEHSRIGRMRTQFVFPVPDHSKSSFKLKDVCEESELVHSDVLTERCMNSCCLEVEGGKEVPPPLNKEVSLWLKTPSAKDETKIAMDVGLQPSKSNCSPNANRLIIGSASASCNVQELCGVSPKQWDANGIPNTITKYKEDQKVNWHATPFEVRLEKALFGEKVYPHRKID